MIAVVTDSTCQLSDAQIRDAGITVVPITITIDGQDYLEGVDLDPSAFYDRLAPGVRLATSQPSPGRFAETYRRLMDGGATEIVSVHVDDSASGTLNSARLAAAMVDVPVHLIDSRMTSYGLGALALRLAAHGREHGSAGVDDIASAMIAATGTVFILRDLDYVVRGGRMHATDLPDATADVPVLGGYGGRYSLIESGRSVDELVDAMARFLLDGDEERHVAIAFAAPETLVFTEALEARMDADPRVVSRHRYRMGPSIAVHTGPGTAGGFRWPARERSNRSRSPGV